MKKFSICPSDFGFKNITCPINNVVIFDSKDLLVSFFEGESVVSDTIAHTNKWDLEGFFRSVPNMKNLSIFEDPRRIKRIVEEFKVSDKHSFRNFLWYEDYLDEFLGYYLLQFGDNIVHIERIGGRSYANSMNDIDMDFYLIDNDNICKDMTQEDFEALQPINI